MSDDMSTYAVDVNGRLVYSSTYKGQTNNYIVWGIGENGFIHGVGSYLSRLDRGYDFIMINKPTYDEIDNYYKKLDKLFGDE